VQLRLRKVRNYETGAVILLAFLIAYWAGARDIALLVAGILLSFLIGCVLGFIRGSFFPKVEMDEQGPPHIILPRE
jgi:hypothetical protein